ncbi:MAG: hypothetical protein ACK4PN_08445 [Allorhizobium sp.]
MSGGNDENLGLPGAHTAAENFAGSGEARQASAGERQALGDERQASAVDQAKAAKVGAVRATVEAAIGDLVGQMTTATEPEQASLMLDEIDEQQALFKGPVRHVANTIDAQRRGRGRPKGSQNKASAEFRDVLMRMGYRHPGLNLAAMANADPAALAIELGVLPDVPEGMDAMTWLGKMVLAGAVKRDLAVQLMTKAQELIARANAELLPYFESKAPTKLDVAKKAVLGVMVIGDMAPPDLSERKTLDLTKFDEPTE